MWLSLVKTLAVVLQFPGCLELTCTHNTLFVCLEANDQVIQCNHSAHALKMQAHVRGFVWQLQYLDRGTLNAKPPYSPVRNADIRVGDDFGGVRVVTACFQSRLEGDVLRKPVRHFLLAQPPPNGVLIQLLVSCNLVFLQTKFCFSIKPAC